MDSHYNLEKTNRIYLNADGGAWIKGGKGNIAGITTVLDEYHIARYLIRMTSHLDDSAEAGRDLLKKALRNGTKADFEEAVELSSVHPHLLAQFSHKLRFILCYFHLFHSILNALRYIQYT